MGEDSSDMFLADIESLCRSLNSPTKQKIFLPNSNAPASSNRNSPPSAPPTDPKAPPVKFERDEAVDRAHFRRAYYINKDKEQRIAPSRAKSFSSTGKSRTPLETVNSS